MNNKMMNYYSKALAEVILKAKSEDAEKISDNFLKLLEKENFLSKAKKIVELAEKIIAQKRGNKVIVLQTARKIEDSDLLKSFYKKGDIVYWQIKPEIIAGINIIINDEKQIDFSLAKKLREMFNSL